VASSFAFESFGVRFGVTADAPEVIERIPHVLPPDARPCPFAEEEFTVLSEEDGRYRFTRPESPAPTGVELEAAGLDLESALFALENQLQVYVGLRAPNRIFVHAGVVGHDGRAIVIPGRSFTGKSTLVFALVSAGAVYYSDEFAVIDERGLVHPYAAPLHLRELPQAADDIERIQWRQGSEPLPVGVVVVTSYQAGAEWKPVRLPPGKGALAMFANALSALTRQQEAVQFIRRALEGAVVLESERGEADEVARQLLHTVCADVQT
jgi:hypothetical protein